MREGRAAAAAAAERYGYEGYYTDWGKMLEDKRIQIFDNGGPNDAHAEPCIEAAKAGKHVFCEKPLARNAKEARSMWDAAVKAGVKHQTAFNYRSVPAVRQAYELIRSGKLGKLYHFRAFYQEAMREWCPRRPGIACAGLGPVPYGRSEERERHDKDVCL